MSTSPQSIINEYSEIIARPALRAIAYLHGREAVPRVEQLIKVLRSSFQDNVTVAVGTHLRPKGQRHPVKEKDFEALTAILDDKARFSGFTLFGAADLKGSNFDLPMIRVQRGGFRFVVELALDPDSSPDTIRPVWDAISSSQPDFALLGFGLLPDPNHHEHERRQAAKAKARYRNAICLDAVTAASVVHDEIALDNHNERSGDDARLGIYDLGWKTILGEAFAKRIDRSILEEIGDLQVVDLPGGALELMFGLEPTWGDVNRGNNYVAPARTRTLHALRPIMASKTLMLRFGGLDDTADAADIIDAYFADWANEDEADVAGDE